MAQATQAWHYRVLFDGGPGVKEYLSPDVRLDPGWMGEGFSRPIKSVEFFLPIGLKIVLAGMKAYVFGVEAMEAMRGSSLSAQSYWLCGHRPRTRIVDRWHVVEGRVESDQVFRGHEWMGNAVSGWKLGAPGGPVSMLMMA